MRKTRLLAPLTTLLILLFLQWHLAASPAVQKASVRQEMTTTEMFSCGIGKLTPSEVANLEEWVAT